MAIAVVLATVSLSVVRAGGGASSPEAVIPPSTRASASSRPEVIPARWARTVPEQAQTLLADGADGAIVIGDGSVSSIALADGGLRWHTPIDTVQPRGAVSGDTVLLSTRTGFVALDRRTGERRWETDTPEKPGPVALVGPEGTPQIAVVSTDEGGLVGLDSRTGRARWSVRYPGRMRGVPEVDDASGTIVSVWQADELATDLRVIDAATGALRWEQPLAVMSSTAIVAAGMVVVGAGRGRHGSEVRAFALADGAPQWRAPVAAPFQPALVPLVDGDDLFVVDQLGHVTRLDLVSGARKWVTDTKALEVYARPIRVDGAILVWNESREVVTLDRATGAIRARRRPAGLPVGLLAARGLVVVAQRLVDRDTIQAFDADRMAAPARSRR
ncbi:MAG: outer membrane protein assembly factor BamB family protein [Acidimicrobiia bacterium]